MANQEVSEQASSGMSVRSNEFVPQPSTSQSIAGASGATAQNADIEGSNKSDKPNKSGRKCRFFNTKAGCRAGDACPFTHVVESPTQVASSSNDAGQSKARRPRKDKPNTATTQVTVDAATKLPTIADAPDAVKARAPPVISRPAIVGSVMSKPVPKAQLEDPRAFQLAQIRRRYNPRETTSNDGSTVLTLDLTPSDPDFPFDMSALQCVLTVPLSYPQNSSTSPSLRVKNADMPRGFQINVEKGFDGLLVKNPKATLLQHLNSLDRDLEMLLTAPKADTVKIVVNARKEDSTQSAASKTASKAPVVEPPQVIVPVLPSKPVQPSYTAEQIAEANTKRNNDTRSLEARLGRLPHFNKYGDGVTYIVPIEPRSRSELDRSLQALKTVKLIVPALYNLVPCRIELPGVAISEDSQNLAAAFEKRARETFALSLVGHINYLSQNMHTMAKEIRAVTETAKPAQIASSALDVPTTIPEDSSVMNFDNGKTTSVTTTGQKYADRPHLIAIPRPPEWTIIDNDTDSDSDDYSYDSGDEDENPSQDETTKNQAQTASISQTPTLQAERGILISFPHLELHAIELLELVSVSLTVRCLRCKDTLDITKLRPNETNDYRGMRPESCKKCANSFAIGYRKDLMHTNSFRAGYLDLDGCTVVDLLPSIFQPTCAECSTPYKEGPGGVTGVRGDSSMAICRECHSKVSFRISEVKFLQVSQATLRATDALPRKKKKTESLGLTVGIELPRRGRCSHYSKSHRWFRFSCCEKVFACDRCHDEVSDHPNEHANRMICGYCSREQNYRPEDCGVCRAVLVGKKGTGFWEGGKGTRDKSRMSRKDPRKYKRKVGSVVGSGKK